MTAGLPSSHPVLSVLSGAELPSNALELWRIDSVMARDLKLISACRHHSTDYVKTLMVTCAFSQIPILSEDKRQLEGVVTWKSLARFSNEGKLTAGDVMKKGVPTARTTDPLDTHVQTVIDNDYICVRDERDVYMGVVTTTDLAKSFVELSGPFMRLREIERQIRQLLAKVSIEEIRAALRPAPRGRPINRVDDLMFGQYVELFSLEQIWITLSLPLDQTVIIDNLRDVNAVRNSVMHFRPEPLTAQQQIVLDWCVNWLNECHG